MLNNFRKTADSIVMKILLLMIIFAFLGWGIADVFKTKKNPEIIKFSDAKNITKNDFLKEKAEQLDLLKKQTSINFTEKQLIDMNFDHIIANKLVQNSILNYWIHYYNLDLTDDTTIQLIQEINAFRNEKTGFDIELFKNFLQNSNLTAEQYVLFFKERYLQSFLSKIFLNSFPVRKAFITQIINYLSETRDIILFEQKLNDIHKNHLPSNPTKQELENYYLSNLHFFELPERRSFRYIKITNSLFKKQIEVSENEILDILNNSPTEFKDKKTNEAKIEIYNKLFSEKAKELVLELVKNLEDDIASGLDLEEIEKKYSLKIENLQEITQEELIKIEDIGENAEDIFELSQNEISYPIEHPNNNSFLIVEINLIQESKVQKFDIVQHEIKDKIIKNKIREFNLNSFKNFAIQYKGNTIIPLSIKSYNMNVSRSQTKDVNTTPRIPKDLLEAIFNNSVNTNTHVFELNDKAYFAYIRAKKINLKTKNELEKNEIGNIINNVKNIVLDELVNYGIIKNNMNINFNNL